MQDLGRTGFRQFGVSTSGALDSFALRVANLLVGNDEGAAGLEITLGGLQLRFEDERVIAWCGGEFDVQIGSRALPAGHVAHLQRGSELKFGRAQIGCRCWLAISGGIDVPVILGSRSTEFRANFGGLEGRVLRNGDQLSLEESRRSQTAATETISSWGGPHDWVSPAKRYPVLRFIRGVDWNRFNSSTLQRFTSEAFGVSSDSDRMGVRLDGPELKRKEETDLVFGSGCSRHNSGSTWRQTDFAFGRLPNYRRLSKNSSCDHSRSWHCGAASCGRLRSLSRSFAARRSSPIIGTRA